MSHYPRMLFLAGGEKSNINAYLFEVAEHQAFAIYCLDSDGNPKSMVTGDPQDVLAIPLKAYDQGYRIIRRGPARDKKPPIQPADWGFYENRWRDVVKILNGKGIRTGEYRELLQGLRNARYSIAELENTGYPWEISSTGIEADRLMDEAEAQRKEERERKLA